ncbi:hypothetical protein ES703_04114 [subsurface metagenome]
MEYTITLSPEEEKALLTDMISIQEWLDNAIHNKARQCIDVIVEQHSDRQPKKLPLEEKLRVVREAKVESATERQAKFEAEMRERE